MKNVNTCAGCVTLHIFFGSKFIFNLHFCVGHPPGYEGLTTYFATEGQCDGETRRIYILSMPKHIST